jgi:hypothetical protein
MPNGAYTEYAMRSEHALFVEFKDGIGTNSQYNTSSMSIEDKLWYYKIISF